ncbi:MAG: glycosyltransferase, partial [Erysipelotrichales bacterium]|nr:glycosyltransferase [Erysipelotrichales bacterium]
MFILASKREGLPRSTMEAMCAGLPCIVSKIRGNVDLIDEGKGGFLVPPKDVDSFASAINILISDKKLKENYGKYNKEKIKAFDINIVNSMMLDLFKKI